jgi:hypothetical protein
MASGQFRPVGEGIDMLRPLFSRPSQISHIDTVRKPLVEDSGSENVLVAGDREPALTGTACRIGKDDARGSLVSPAKLSASVVE